MVCVEGVVEEQSCVCCGAEGCGWRQKAVKVVLCAEMCGCVWAVLFSEEDGAHRVRYEHGA